MHKKTLIILGVLLLGFAGCWFLHGKPAPREAAPSVQSQSGGPGKDSDNSKTPGPSDPGVSQPGAQNTADRQASLQSSIENKYNARLQSLAATYEGRLNGLMGEALAGYTSAREKDPQADIKPLVNKYYSAGKALEAECDSRVYPVLEAFENELKSNGLPTGPAQRAREGYEARKAARAGQITPPGP